ncbi:hypothetical protein CDEST_15284 [Colletotrichum destructivum]|uniref:Uncharacterized protein n=1 Tax=Colletotrichum destructivum TaxID=34406 RepID=A0AAX4J4D4_9PEZI|nr:hypothetical protein CDEST_15284 [Colletotrichum destructivum]
MVLIYCITKSPTKALDKPNKTYKTKKLEARALRNIKSYTTPKYVAPGQRVIGRKYNGERAKQACYNYSSIIARRRDLQSLTCTSDKALRAPQSIVGVWNEQHHTSWSSGWLQEANLESERDEYPGASVWQARDDSVWIQNLVAERSIDTSVEGCRTYDVWQRTL